MDWQKTAFDWNRARAFLVTAEEGSFSAAARAMGQAQPTVGRQVAALEEELGVVLFERVGHSLVLTTTGSELAEQVRAMNEAATRFSLIAAGTSQSLEGLVRIAASQAISAYLLPAIVEELRVLHPHIQVEIVASNVASDLRKREADIAVRNFRPQGEDLVTRLVKDSSQAFLYAAPSYLARIGNPCTLQELVERGQVLAFDDSDLLKKTLRAKGYAFGDDRFVLRTEDHLVQWELAKRGLGMCVMMQEIGDAEPAVQRVLSDAPPIGAVPLWLTAHRELKTSRRIRVVFDLLAQRLGG